jgi:hypothetical protein
MRRERRRDRSLFEPRSAPVRDFAAQAEAVASLVQPVIVGKRALLQLSLTSDVASVIGVAAR